MIPDKDKKTLSRIGRGPEGRELINILSRASASLSSIDDIKEGDYGAQVEGRKLFKTFVKHLIESLSSEARIAKPIETDEFD